MAVAGQLRFREWESDEGAKRSEHSIAADRVDFLAGGRRRDSDEQAEEEEGEHLIA